MIGIFDLENGSDFYAYGEVMISYGRKNMELMLYTGLKDKKGKEIYEGDIIIEYPGQGCEWRPRQGPIEYKDASFWLNLGGFWHILTEYDCTLEVIGNIYENPKLLNENNS